MISFESILLTCHTVWTCVVRARRRNIILLQHLFWQIVWHFNVNTNLPKKIGWYRSMEHKLPLLKRFVGWFRNWNWSFLKVWNAAWEIQIIFSVKRILQFFPKINKIEQQTNPVWKWLRILFATCGAAVWRKVGFKTWIWKC